jgi:hypothetical protein
VRFFISSTFGSPKEMFDGVRRPAGMSSHERSSDSCDA